MGVVMAIIVVAAATAAQGRDEVARHYAPTIYQETHASRARHDFITAFDYDCDDVGDNNRDNLDAFPLPALVYFSVVETQTHWLMHYLPYHPTDDKLTNGHEHDTESILLVVRKTAAPFGQLEAMETRFHTNWYQYAAGGISIGNAGDNVDATLHLDDDGVRPAVYQQAVGHGICGGFSPPCWPSNDYCDLALLCNHDEAPRFNRRGVRYRFGSSSAEPADPGESGTIDAPYELISVEETLWARRFEIGPGRMYASAISYQGSRCDDDAGLTCPTQFGGKFQGDEGSPPGAMWAQEGGKPSLPDGEVFFDPAYAMSRRLSFPDPFSLVYIYNPYVGIGALAERAPTRSCGGDGGEVPDAATAVDAHAGDARVVDAAMPDAARDDAGVPSDAGARDAAFSPDAAEEEQSPSSRGCGCDTARTSPSLLALLGLVVVNGLRRRRTVWPRRPSPAEERPWDRALRRGRAK